MSNDGNIGDGTPSDARFCTLMPTPITLSSITALLLPFAGMPD
ncbi:hypothetical protein [Dickeya chrysanthemi]|nr:hypothetical protein [Dickeya chrysanthemi]